MPGSLTVSRLQEHPCSELDRQSADDFRDGLEWHCVDRAKCSVDLALRRSSVPENQTVVQIEGTRETCLRTDLIERAVVAPVLAVSRFTVGERSLVVHVRVEIGSAITELGTNGRVSNLRRRPVRIDVQCSENGELVIGWHVSVHVGCSVEVNHVAKYACDISKRRMQVLERRNKCGSRVVDKRLNHGLLTLLASQFTYVDDRSSLYP